MIIGVLSPASIAINRFLPALSKVDGITFGGVAVANISERGNLYKEDSINISFAKAKNIVDSYGGKIYNSFNEMLSDETIDAVYIPLPPAIHYKWGRAALDNGKHVFMEKPFTTCLNDTNDLIEIAGKNNKVVFENYMFVHHIQCSEIDKVIKSGAIGGIRLLQLSFGFPIRDTNNDFRYKREYGGGAIYDCAGYPIKLASIIMNNPQILFCNLNYNNRFKVDLFGDLIMKDKDGVVAEISFGMDNDYRCSLNAWGSSGTLISNRVFTAPPNFVTNYSIIKNNVKEDFVIGCDDAFYNSIQYFRSAIDSAENRKKLYCEIKKQSEFIDTALRLANE